MYRVLPWLFGLLLTFTVKVADAHRVGLYGALQGDQVVGEATFGKGRPCKACEILVLDHENKEIASGRTDQDGRFSIPVSLKGIQSITLVLEAGPGHRAQWQIIVDDKAMAKREVSTTGPSNISHPPLSSFDLKEIKAIIREEILKANSQIMAELQGLKERAPGPSEILGGIGYIVGLMGLFLYLKAKKDKGH